MDSDIPLYIVGLEEESSQDLIVSKFKKTLQRIESAFSRVTEARVIVKRKNVEGKRKTYEVSVMVITKKQKFNYEETGWDISNICESIVQKLLDEMTKHDSDRQKTSIRKIQRD